MNDSLLLGNADCRVRVDAARGGRIASLCVYGEELLVGAGGDPLAWGSYPLAPWAGRLRGGRFCFEGREYRMPCDSGAHAIHGTMFRRGWQIVAGDTLRIELQPGWPFDGFALQRFRLHDNALEVRLELHARTRPYPASAGFHPWFLRRLRHGAPLALDLGATQRIVLDSEGLPTGARAAPETATGDDCFIGLHREPCLRWPGALRLWLSSNHAHWVVYEHPAHAVCVEPWTAPPDALNGTPALVRPGAPLVLEMRLRWERDA
jgi:aldose 1-epimerase